MLSDFTFANGLHLTLLVITLFTGMLGYFRIAEHYRIVDRPGIRSSHNNLTIRGGGVVFIIALLCWFSLYRLEFPWFVLGALILGVVSFADDIKSQRPIVRISGQLASFCLIILQTGIYHEPWWIVALVFVIGIGALNAFNFMDGINGMTGVYALANLITFYYVNTYIIRFSHTSLIVCMMVAVLVFLFFNFRTHARCFAGDVGSISLAFVQIFLLLLLIAATGNYKWVLVFLVYGVDAVVTIVYRLWRKENIFKAHRSHLYQYLANEVGVPQLVVSFCYGLLQFIVNLLIIGFLKEGPSWVSIVFILVVGFSYVGVREMVMRRVGR